MIRKCIQVLWGMRGESGGWGRAMDVDDGESSVCVCVCVCVWVGGWVGSAINLGKILGEHYDQYQHRERDMCNYVYRTMFFKINQVFANNLKTVIVRT